MNTLSFSRGYTDATEIDDQYEYVEYDLDALEIVQETSQITGDHHLLNDFDKSNILNSTNKIAELKDRMVRKGWEFEELK